MKIALAQLNYTIGDFDENAEKIIRSIRKARQEKANLVVFSELSVCGYPPLDLLEHKDFLEKCEKSVALIAAECHGIAAIVGSPSLNSESTGKKLRNSAFFLANGRVQQVFHKSLLPTYDIFDEYRYFEPNSGHEILKYKGVNIAVTICEDLWYKQPILTDFGKDRLYTENPMESIAALCPDILINIAASPYSYMQGSIKQGILAENASRYRLPLFYVNQVGAHAELIFDGGSMVVSQEGVLYRLKQFDEDFVLFDTTQLRDLNPLQLTEEGDRIDLVHDALVMGIRDYAAKTGFRSAILGLSGGIDSAVTLVLAARAMGVSNTRVLLMPSQYSSDHSVADAVALARNLGVRYDKISIHDVYAQFMQALDHVFRDTRPDVTEENIQARIRGNLLMAVSNKFGNLLLNTSNKSEAAVGYGTLYGDMSGGLSVLGDVYKTEVYRLADYINRDREVIPANTISKPPSAELRPDQKDTDSLPDYGVLDRILYQYIELQKPVADIVASGIHTSLVERVVRMVNQNEYKRYQTPPILRISTKAFGSGRRMPLVAKY